MPQPNHARQVLAVLNGGADPARSVVAASWRRCLTVHRLDPEDDGGPPVLTAGELAEAREQIGLLVHAAEPVLDRLFQAVGASGACVLLTDRNGVPVSRRGAAGDDDIFRRRGLWTGAVWSEASGGTNGIGTCLAEQRALTIHRDQHFHTRNIGLSCTVAPLFDPQGRLAGALDVSSARTDLAEGMIGLVQGAVLDAVRRIEAQAFRMAFPDARIVLLDEGAGGPERASTPLVAVDRDDRVVGATRAARQSLKLDDERLARGLPAADLTDPDGRAGSSDLLEAERGALTRALARAAGNVSAAAADLGVSRATLHRRMNRLGLTRRPEPRA